MKRAFFRRRALRAAGIIAGGVVFLLICSSRTRTSVFSARVNVAPWGRHRLFDRSSSVPRDHECGMRGYLVGKGSLEQECVCRIEYTGKHCGERLKARLSFGISYLMYGETGVEMTVKKSIERTRAALSSRYAYEFVVFHDRFSSKRLACFEKTHSTKLVQISLPVHLNGTCTCAPSGLLDLHCSANDVQYRGMALFRATRQFKAAELLEHTYVIVMDAEAHFLGGDPFSELLEAEAGFAFYAWGAINDRSCMGDIREWAIDLVRTWGVDTRLFELAYGTMAPECIFRNLNVPAVCCGVRVSSFSGDVVAFRTDVMRTKPVQRMLRAWEDTSMLRDNRSTEQELWPNLFGLLLPPAAIHQFSEKIELHAHIGYMRGEELSCTPEPHTKPPPLPLSPQPPFTWQSQYLYDGAYFAPSPPAYGPQMPIQSSMRRMLYETTR